MQFGQLGDFFRPDHISRFWPLGDMALRLTVHTVPWTKLVWVVLVEFGCDFFGLVLGMIVRFT